jgi:phosphoribosylglycinamide formyltransferase-1
MTKRRVAVLVSGRGSNLKALVEACAKPEFPAEIAFVFSNKPDAPALRYAREAGIPASSLSAKGFPSREAFDAAAADVVAAHAPDIVCLAGYMRLLTPAFIRRWPDRILNIHPSLLPSFKGLDAQRQALEAGVKIAGCTVHIVREEMDSGPILLQEAVPVPEGDTEESLSARLLPVEHRLYVEALALLAGGRVRTEGNRARIGV